MASAAIPAYLLAREVLPGAGRVWAGVATVLAIAIPWMTLSGFVLSEPAAYPAFLWAVWLLQRAVVEPTRGRDLAAIGGLALAFFTRPQFAVLAIVLVVAIVLHELRFADDWRAGLRAAFDRHRTLAAAIGGVVAAALLLVAITGSTKSVLGTYGVTATTGSPLPLGTPRAAAVHIDVLAVALGVAPLVLGLGWALSAAWRPGDRRTHAYALVTALSVVGMVVEVASYDLRFGGSDVVRDRYLFYLAPLLLLATLAWLLDARRRLWAPAALAVLFAATTPLDPWHPVAGDVHIDKFGAILYSVYDKQAGSLDTSIFLGIAGVLLVAAALLARGFLPALPVAVVVSSLMFVFLAAESGYLFDRLLANNGPSGRPVTGDPSRIFNWVDLSVPGDRDAGVVPYATDPSSGTNALLWWDVEFYNHSIERSYQEANTAWTYTPFRNQTMAVDFGDGRITTTYGSEVKYLVVAQGDPRFRFLGEKVGQSYGLDILIPQHPYRAEWATRGLDDDGYTLARQPAVIRVYAIPGHKTEGVDLTISLQGPADKTVSYDLAGHSAPLGAGKTHDEHETLCVPAGGHADVSLQVARAAVEPPSALLEHAPDREVGPRVVGIAAARSGTSC